MLEKLKLNLKKFIVSTLTVIAVAILFVLPINFQSANSNVGKNQNKIGSVADTSKATISSKKTTANEISKNSHEPIAKSEPIETTTGKVLQETIAQATGEKNREKETVDLKISTSTSNYSYQVSWRQGMSVYDVLESASHENKFSLVAKWYGMPLNSYYIIEIHSFNCECWTYTLKDKNGEKVPGSGEGASLDTVEPGNIIIWKAT
ncbi:MAG: hypothetical protein WD187_02590 [Candidatus Woykebacteria bacterium]